VVKGKIELYIDRTKQVLKIMGVACPFLSSLIFILDWRLLWRNTILFKLPKNTFGNELFLFSRFLLKKENFPQAAPQTSFSKSKA